MSEDTRALIQLTRDLVEAARLNKEVEMTEEMMLRPTAQSPQLNVLERRIAERWGKDDESRMSMSVEGKEVKVTFQVVRSRDEVTKKEMPTESRIIEVSQNDS